MLNARQRGAVRRVLRRGRPARAPRAASRRGSRSLAFLVVAAFLLVNKVWSPQYSLWLVPLAVLALPRWRLLLAWMVVDALVWVPRMFYYVGPPREGLPPDWFLGAVVARDAIVVVLMRAGGAHGAAAGDGPGPHGGPGRRPGLAGRGAHDRAARRRPAGAQLVRTLAGTLVGAASRSTANAVGTRRNTTNSATSSAARPHTPIATAWAANPPPMPASRPALSR